jgi:hypothetical protein
LFADYLQGWDNNGGIQFQMTFQTTCAVRSRRGLMYTCLLTAAIIFCCGEKVIAQQPASPLVAVRLQLKQQTVMVGEPLVIAFSYTNLRGEDIRCRHTSNLTDDYERSLVTLSLQTVTGETIIRGKAYPLDLDTGGYRHTYKKLGTSESHSGLTFVPRQFLPTKPGKYVLHVSSRFSYQLARTRFGRVQKTEIDLPFTAVAGSDKELQAVADTLYKQIARDEEPEARIAVRSLLQMPESVVSPFWSRVTRLRSNKNLDRFVDGLCERQSPLAVGLLAEMWETHAPVAPAVADLAKQGLRYLYPRVDREAKERIRAAYISHDCQDEVKGLPETVDKELRFRDG